MGNIYNKQTILLKVCFPPDPLNQSFVFDHGKRILSVGMRNSMLYWFTLIFGTEVVKYQNQGQEADWPYFISAFIKQ